MPKVRVTITGPREFGIRCLRMILTGGEPAAWAASTYSFSLIDSTCPRTSRASPTQLTRPIATKMLMNVGPSAATMMRTNSRSGKAYMMSVNRISALSIQPPK